MTTTIEPNRTRPYRPLIATLPDDLRSVDEWLYPGGLYDYMTALSQFIGADRRVGPVMNAAGLSVADWIDASDQSHTFVGDVR